MIQESPAAREAGNQPGDGCATCLHPEVEAVNALINEGRTPSREIARRYGLGKDSVNRHAFKMHPGVAVRYPGRGAPGQPPVPPGARGTDARTELQKLEEQRQLLEDGLRRSARADLSRELRQVNQRIGEIRGEGAVREVGLADVQGLAEQLRRWADALEPFPEARDAMLAATDEALLGAAGLP